MRKDIQYYFSKNYILLQTTNNKSRNADGFVNKFHLNYCAQSTIFFGNSPNVKIN